MFTYKFLVDEQRNNSVRLRITNNRKKAELGLGLELSQENLENALSAFPTQANRRYSKLFMIYRMKIEDLNMHLMETGRVNLTAIEIRDLIKTELFGQEPQPEVKDKVGTFLPHYIKIAETRPAKRTQEIYLTTVSRMQAYDPKLSELDFEDITVEWLMDFDRFLMKTSPKKNSRNIHFRNIRAVMKDAFKADLTTAHPFDRFKHGTEPTRKRSFSVETIRKIFNAEVEPWQQKYLDFFKLTFMLVGVNAVDLCNATEIYEGRLEYDRAKTHKPYSIKIEPEAMEIIDRYRGETRLLNMVEGYANYRHFYNNLCKGLNAIKEQLGLKYLTTYWARHTWSSIAYNELGISKDVISQALGHSNGNSVTDIYIDFSLKLIDDANRKVLDYVLYGKRQ